MSTPPFIRPFRKSRVKPHELAGSKVEAVTHPGVSVVLSNEPVLISPIVEVQGTQVFEDYQRPVVAHPEELQFKRKEPRLERKEPPTRNFVAGSSDTPTKRRCEVKFKLKNKLSSTGYYYRCKQTPETYFETLQQLNSSMSPEAAKQADSKEGPSPRKLALDDIGYYQKRKVAQSTLLRNHTGRKPGKASFKKKDRKPGKAAFKKENVLPPLAVMEVLEYKATLSLKGKLLNSDAAVPQKKRRKHKPGVPNPNAPKRIGNRPWKWFPCEQCVCCMRLDDCGKCGQCRNGKVGICILRQCITPVRADDVTPKRLLSDDDESLEGLDSDVSDLEWEEAFPEEEFGSLTRDDLLQRWMGKQDPQEVSAATLDMPNASI